RVLERRAVAVAHQEVDEARGPPGVGLDLCERLLSLRRDPPRPQHVGVGSRVFDQLDGHVAPEPDLFASIHRPQSSRWRGYGSCGVETAALLSWGRARHGWPRGGWAPGRGGRLR